MWQSIEHGMEIDFATYLLGNCVVRWRLPRGAPRGWRGVSGHRALVSKLRAPVF